MYSRRQLLKHRFFSLLIPFNDNDVILKEGCHSLLGILFHNANKKLFREHSKQQIRTASRHKFGKNRFNWELIFKIRWATLQKKTILSDIFFDDLYVVYISINTKKKTNCLTYTLSNFENSNLIKIYSRKFSQ